MKKYGLISTIALIVLTNVVVLAGVTYNRSGEPDATIMLTERELHWQNSWSWVDREDSGLHLKLKWSMSGYRRFDWEHWKKTWFNVEKLAALGFDTNFPLDDKKASRYYSRQLPRQGYVVLEYNGDAYQDWLRGSQKRIIEVKKELAEEKKVAKQKNLENDIRNMERLMITQSHLFAIDAARDPKILRKQYADPSKYIITPAVFRISMHHPKTREYNPKIMSEPPLPRKRYLVGRISEILIPIIHVTSDYRSFFISDIKTHTKTYLPKGKPLSDLKPRYQVTLNYGKRYEPWIADVKKLK